MKHTTKCLLAFVHAVCLIGLVSVTTVDFSVAAEPQAGIWSGGAAIGFLGNTPDGTRLYVSNYTTNTVTVLAFVDGLAPEAV